ncbi:ProQ/FinO family protein [Robbsia sp. Bb-Pol-6]|uniref:ProQ/FinO family protein n=1 Tax=Robbsia betulipollinis TaxID=2981849 RepID=A0ABT3ZH07_9BURK|nr:ProQ/FinO family protein [Robbsia betulipollinis]MCY0385811.1 ProQ/FinO family protein [Robbsia betulipollinis]
MGFEELAALKQQLSKRTQAAKPERADTQGAARAAVASEGTAAAAPRPPRRQTPGSHGQNAGKPGAHRGPRSGGSASAEGQAPAGAQRNERRTDSRASKRAEGPASEGVRHRAQQRDTPRVGQRQDARRPTTPVDPVVITIGQLQKRFPKAFPKNPLPKVPLKLGISKDLLAQAESLALSEAELLEAIKVWCQGNRYWSSMTKDSPRVDLAGEPEGTVTPEQASRARSLSATHRRAKRPAVKKTEPAAADAGLGGETPTPPPEQAAESADPTDGMMPASESVDRVVENASSVAQSAQSVDASSNAHDASAGPASDHPAAVV